MQRNKLGKPVIGMLDQTTFASYQPVVQFNMIHDNSSPVKYSANIFSEHEKFA